MTLRTLASVAAIVLGLLPGAAVASPNAATTKYRVDELRAQWFVPTADEDAARSFVVHVQRRTDVDTGEVRLTAAAGRARCSADPSVLCVTFLSRYRVVEFEADPGLTTAHAVIERGRWRHEVTFSPSLPYAYTPPVAQNPTTSCEGGTVTTVSLTAKNATAEGTVFGEEVSTAGEVDSQRESEKMVQTLDVEECP